MRYFIALLFSIVSMSVTIAQQTVNFIGDSYVANHKCSKEETWHFKMALELGLKYNNYGRNGSCVAWDRTHDGKFNFGPAMWQRASQMDPNADYVVVIGGHNDAVKIGHSKDSLAMFCDSLELLIMNIRIQCPNARIGWVTPWYVDRPGFDVTCKAIKRICHKHGIPVLWNYSKHSPIKVRDAEFRKQYFQGSNDTAHLNNAGHDLFLPTGKEWFEKYMMHKK